MARPGGASSGQLIDKPTLAQSFSVDNNLLVTTLPSPPEDLDEEGADWWNYYCSLFIQGKILSKLFLTAIHNLCLQHVIRKQLIDHLNGKGFWIEEWIINKDKEPENITRINPVVKDLERCLTIMDRLLASLGMTAYTSKVNNFDSTGAKTRAKNQRPPASSLPTPQKDQ